MAKKQGATFLGRDPAVKNKSGPWGRRGLVPSIPAPFPNVE